MHREPVDFRWGLNGLVALIEHRLRPDPFAAACFVFSNRRRDKVKLVSWERNGFWLCYKKWLERERFVWPRAAEAVMVFSMEQLGWLLSGIDLAALRSLIGELYAIEAQALAAADRRALRHRDSAPLLARIQQRVEIESPGVAPQSLLGKALHYLSQQWPKLVRFLEDGDYPLDNNAAENAIRPFVIGRKNWLFSDTVKGAQASANLYSLIETAKANGLEPYRYLCHVFNALPAADTVEKIEALLPWTVARAEGVTTPASIPLLQSVGPRKLAVG
ncbi:MAG: IS66 family insertion sequence element accessory protein TnpB [Gammaproteobacteria bacterium]|nr:IS66 family insertion sequence element accessory protein TnpB [Gammaproteobacteria bacterium]